MEFSINGENNLTYKEVIDKGSQYIDRYQLTNLLSIGLDIMSCIRYHKIFNQHLNIDNFTKVESIVNVFKDRLDFKSHEHKLIEPISISDDTHKYLDRFIFEDLTISMFSNVYVFFDGYLKHAFVEDIIEFEVVGNGEISGLYKLTADLDEKTVAIKLVNGISCVISLKECLCLTYYMNFY